MNDLPLLSDDSEKGKFRLSGGDALRFLQTLTTGDIASLACYQNHGELTRCMLLDADGQIIDVVIVAHSGDGEYLLLSSACNVTEVFSWLSAYAVLEEESGPVFSNLVLEDRSDDLALFQLYGEGSEEIIHELTAGSLEDLPLVDTICATSFDGVPLLLLCEDLGGDETLFTMMAVPAAAQGIANILLSFPEICIQSPEDTEDHLIECGLSSAALADERYTDPVTAGLTHLMREGSTFVGARAILQM